MTPRTAVAVDCHVRTSSLVEPVDATVERIRELDKSGVIDALSVKAWPDEVPLTEDSNYPDVLECFESYQSWADRFGASIKPAFGVRERTTLVDNTTEEVLVLPVLCLSIHVNGELVSVAPHIEGEVTYTVEDALADLESLDSAIAAPLHHGTSNRSTASFSDPSIGEQCPACAKGLTSGQGLYACASCSWVGTDPTQVDKSTRAANSLFGEDAKDHASSKSRDQGTRHLDEQPPRPST